MNKDDVDAMLASVHAIGTFPALAQRLKRKLPLCARAIGEIEDAGWLVRLANGAPALLQTDGSLHHLMPDDVPDELTSIL
ncbi:hypothetical protein [Methylovirgula sp. 4M-Z18]|uniref:hypothetical protein n=1 Tax=Methylovirgula sp. 4M-Z18 TaxID=2293567 RepID=UPI000E2FD172|nr:hypothetical protein [Methylovirgula sp. 4M-Z18]RFB76645.1 hypothetical protein DYH55_19475 [Methylovirgula sp. 4M-Z18]